MNDIIKTAIVREMKLRYAISMYDSAIDVFNALCKETPDPQLRNIIDLMIVARPDLEKSISYVHEIAETERRFENE